MTKRLHRFKGGVDLDYHKAESAGVPIRSAPLPPRLIVPLRQNARSVAHGIVTAGEHVLKGQRIGEAEGVLGTAVHAPTSGTVIEVTEHPMAHPSGLDTHCVVIEPDGDERWVALEPLDHRSIDRQSALNRLREAGVVGLGGAAFPSHVKLGSGTGVDTVVINGAECEPWITCDDRLMRERADQILAGAAILSDLIGAKRVLVGIEDNKPEAIAAMRAAAAAQAAPIEIVAIPTVYPAGGEKQLIRVLTGIEIPHGRLGTDFGVQCFNVGTAAAVHRAFALGEPLVSRIVTLAGNVERPGNYEVLIGTPVASLLELAEPRADTDRYILGGPMMGFALPDLSVPVIKGTNCVLSASPTLFPRSKPPLPCIRCGECARACPAELQPFELYWFAHSRNFGKAQEYHLFDCIECGCCSYVCPSHIPLVDYYRYAKSEIWARERETRAADGARERFEFRNFRQEREKAEKAAKLAAKAAETKAKLAQTETAPAPAPTEAAPQSEDDAKRALIAAALERAKQQKAAAKPKNTEDLSAATLAEIAEIEARRKALGLSEGDAGDVRPALPTLPGPTTAATPPAPPGGDPEPLAREDRP